MKYWRIIHYRPSRLSFTFRQLAVKNPGFPVKGGGNQRNFENVLRWGMGGWVRAVGAPKGPVRKNRCTRNEDNPHSSFPKIHKVGNVVIFVLLRSEG